jgi:chromosome partitioning protein
VGAVTIVALAGQKGGVGKSTVAICLAAEALERGWRVLLVDGDPQQTARTWGEVASEAGHPTPTIVAMGPTMHRPEQLARVAVGYRLVLIDCPPRSGDVQRSALLVADRAILPCGPSAADAWALASSIALVGEARALRPELRAAILLTRTQARTALARGARRVFADCELAILSTEIGQRVAYQEALAAGQGVTRYAPASAAAAEVRALLTEILPVKTPQVKAHARKKAAR